MLGKMLAAVLTAVLSAGLLVGGQAGAAHAATAPADPVVTISGHGWGHGRGMGQWGALGYAVDGGWSWQQILGHYYGGTKLTGDFGNPPIGVELLSKAGSGIIVTSPSLAVDGLATSSGAVYVRRVGTGAFEVLTGPGCGGPWRPWGGRTFGSGLVVSSLGDPARPEQHLQICESSLVRGVRGDLQVVESGGKANIVNRLLLDDYLRGVVPKESSAAWAGLGGGRGMAALAAQAVAARSYAVSAPRNSYATTCDTTACQVYGGEYTRPFNSLARTSQEDPRTDAAVAMTSRHVMRRSNGAVARTEFSSSTGGWSAGGDFPAVQDLGDAYAGNPNHSWTVRTSWSAVARALGTSDLRGLKVTRRNGLGAGGGRVLEVVADTGQGQLTFTGSQIRTRLGLKSDWFAVSTTSAAEARAFVTAVYRDLLGRAPSAGEVDTRSREIASGADRSKFATDVAGSYERIGHLVDETYRAGLGRGPSPAERDGWTRWYLAGRGLPDLRAAVFGSHESVLSVGRGDDTLWVDALYRGILGRSASPGERSGWAAEASGRGRAAVARQIAVSTEARARRLDVYYRTMLGRAPDAGASGWLPALAGTGDVSVPAGIAGSGEYWGRAAQFR